MNQTQFTFDIVSWTVASGLGGFLFLASRFLANLGGRGHRPKTWAVVHGLLLAYALFVVWASVALLLLQPGLEQTPIGLGLGLGGLFGTISLAWSRPSRWRALRVEEERRMTALDL